MPKPKTSEELVVIRSRRATNAWVEQHLRGTTVVTRVTPKPVAPRRTPRVKIGRVEFLCRNDFAPAHTTVTTPRFELVVRAPVAWHAREDFALPEEHQFGPWSRPRRPLGKVGLHFGSFWLSGDELEIRTLTPQIESVAPRFRRDDFRYAFTHGGSPPSPLEWIRWARLGGVEVVLVDDNGFRADPEHPPPREWGWKFVEDRPLNLSSPLSFEIPLCFDETLRLNCWSVREGERAEALKAFLTARLEDRPGLVVLSGNCQFSVAEWREVLAQPEHEPLPRPRKESAEVAQVVSLADRRSGR